MLDRFNRRAMLTALSSTACLSLVGCGARSSDNNRVTPSYAALDRLQLGHLQHVKNLASQPDGDWSKMGANDPEQAGLSSYRYQLAYMAYTLAVTHYHHLPAAPGVFKSAYEAIMRKMLRFDVWAYWYDTSRSGPRLDPDLTELREPWRDPVVKENIMYSGHVLAMVGLYEMLFNDKRYSKPGGLTFAHQPMFWGAEGFSFEYDFTSLKDVIFLQMLRNGWLGVECEPNNIFVVCNQFPILGFRLHDSSHGTTDAELTTRAYRAAWERKGGFTGAKNSITSTYLVRQEVKTPPMGLEWDAWTGAVLNAWAPDYARELYNLQAERYFRNHEDGRVSLYARTVLDQVAVQRESGDPQPVLLDRDFSFGTPAFGYSAIWFSELGDRERLDGLLAHADKFMQPIWERGGLYYPRNDQTWNSDGELVEMEPFTGNALLAYARLNPAGGLNAIYQNPWLQRHLTQPALVNDPNGVYISRGDYEPSTRELRICLEPINERTRTQLNIARGASARWELFADQTRIARSDDGVFTSSDSVSITPTGARDFSISLELQSTQKLTLRWA